MRVRYPIVAFLFITFLGVRCTRTADVDLPPHTPSLVLHSYVDVGDRFRATLGKTIHTSEWVVDTATYVNDGWMALYENGVLIDSLRYDQAEQRYISDTAFAWQGKTYTIRAGAPGYTTVEASAKAPQAIATKSLQHIYNARTDISGSPLNDIVFSFDDPFAERNYYLAALYPAYPGTGYLCVYTYDPSVEKYTEGLLPFDQNSCIGNQEILFSDRSFNGKQKQITLSANAFMLSPFPDPISGDTLKPLLKRYNITEEYYRYFKQTNTLNMNSGGPTLTDPVIIRGNVKNGYGLFTIYASTVDSLP